MDTQWLDSWVQQQHLQRDAPGGARAAFTSHPARLLLLRSFLKPPIAEQIGRFLCGEVLFARAYGLHSADTPVNHQRWLQASEEDLFYRYGLVKDCRSGCELSENLIAYLKLRVALRDARFASFLMELTGLGLGATHGPTAHAFHHGDFLRPHNDRGGNRQLAYVLYLTAHWRPAYGGALRVRDLDGNVHETQPDFNSLLIFDVEAQQDHSVTTVEAEAQAATRLSLGGWFEKSSGTDRPPGSV